MSWSQIETERCHSLGIFLVSLFVLSDKVHRNGSCLFIPEQTFLSETRVVFLSLSRTAVEFKHLGKDGPTESWICTHIVITKRKL